MVREEGEGVRPPLASWTSFEHSYVLYMFYNCILLYNHTAR